jgi:hemoglobin
MPPPAPPPLLSKPILKETFVTVQSQISLYERLGGAPGIAATVEDVWANHTSNPLVKARYASSDPEKVKRLVREQFGAATGGPETYTGRDMLSAHKGLNISEQEFLAVIDDVLDALSKNGVGQKEQDEVLAILYSTRKDIIRV